MKLFECQVCRNALHFENTSCVECGGQVAYLPDRFELSVVRPENGLYRAVSDEARSFAMCANAGQGGCNWLVTDKILVCSEIGRAPLSSGTRCRSMFYPHACSQVVHPGL